MFPFVACRVAEPSGLAWNLMSMKIKPKSNQHANRFHHYEKCPPTTLTQIQTECPIDQGAGEWETCTQDAMRDHVAGQGGGCVYADHSLGHNHTGFFLLGMGINDSAI
jgi:hypothetical protein